jgi:cysteinyl-tRNA synthetase
MSERYLGTEFEIHGGGLDLVFPHHENEIAQSQSLGHRFARIWLHNGMLEFAGSEMHKSIGNVVTLADALDRWGRETVLVFFLTGHWRKPLEYSDETLTAAAARTERLREVFRNPSEPAPAGAWDAFAEALDDDFNTAQALAVVHEWRDHDVVRRALDVFGLASLAEHEAAPPELVDVAERRKEARLAGEFAEADRLRAEIESAGWEVRDVAEPPGYRLIRRAV